MTNKDNAVKMLTFAEWIENIHLKGDIFYALWLSEDSPQNYRAIEKAAIDLLGEEVSLSTSADDLYEMHKYSAYYCDESEDHSFARYYLEILYKVADELLNVICTVEHHESISVETIGDTITKKELDEMFFSNVLAASESWKSSRWLLV